MASSASAILSSSSERSWGVVFFQVSKAVSAASTARSTSSAELAGTLAMTWSLAGLMTSAVAPVGGVDELAADELLVGLDALEGVGHGSASWGVTGRTGECRHPSPGAVVRPAVRAWGDPTRPPADSRQVYGVGVGPGDGDGFPLPFGFGLGDGDGLGAGSAVGLGVAVGVDVAVGLGAGAGVGLGAGALSAWAPDRRPRSSSAPRWVRPAQA